MIANLYCPIKRTALSSYGWWSSRDIEVDPTCNLHYTPRSSLVAALLNHYLSIDRCVFKPVCIWSLYILQYADLAEGDICKIDLGVHVDGFISVVAHTIVVGSTTSLSESELARRNNCISAAYTAAEVAVRMMKAGNTNAMVTKAIKQVADAFDVRPLSGTLMHQMKQYVIDGAKMILLKEEPDQQKIEPCTFEIGDVFAIDIAMSTGDGKPRESETRTTVFKRNVDRKYSLKNKSSREFFNIVNKRFPTMPFSIRSFEDEKAAKMGVRECVNHELLMQFPGLIERKEEFVAHVKVTVLLLPSGNTAQITGLPPLTYIEAVQAQASGKSDGSVPELPAVDPASAATKLSASLPIGLTLTRILQAQKGVTMPEEVALLLEQLPAESKKKAKNAKKKAAAKGETAEAK